MGSSGQDSVQASTIWGGYILGEYIFFEIFWIWISSTQQMRWGPPLVQKRDVSYRGIQPTSFGAKTWRHWQGDPTDLLWCKNVTSPTGGSNRTFRCLGSMQNFPFLHNYKNNLKTYLKDNGEANRLSVTLFWERYWELFLFYYFWLSCSFSMSL